MRIGRVRCKPRVPRCAHAPRCPRRSLRRRDPARACRVAAGDFEGLSCRGDDVDFQRDRKTGNRSRNVPPAPSVGGFLSAGVARTLGSNSPSRRTDLACPATPSPGMQDMDSVARNLLVPARPGGGSRFREFAVVEREERFESIPVSGVADSGKTGAPAGSQSRDARCGRLPLPWTRAFAKRWSLVPHRWLTGLPR